MIKIELQFFGAFRQYELPGEPLYLSFDGPTPVEKIKTALAARLGQNVLQLIQDSALADERQILAAGHVVDKSCVLSILPPVCGG